MGLAACLRAKKIKKEFKDKKMKKVNFKEQISAIKSTGCSNYFTVLRERVDYAYSIKKVNRFGDFLLEGRVIELDIQKDKNIFMCKMSIDPMGIKWVDFSTASYLPKLFQVFFIRSRRWNCRVVNSRSFIWSEVSIKQTEKLVEAEQRELKKNMSSYYEEYGHYEVLDQKIQKLEDTVILESESATNREKIKRFKLKNKIITRTSIYTYRKKKKKIKPYRGYRKDKFNLRIFSTQNLTTVLKEFLVNLRSRRVFFPGLGRFTYPAAGSKFFYPRSTVSWVKHKELSLNGFIKIYNTVLLLPSYSSLADGRIRLRSANRKQVSLNSYSKTSFFSNWLSWNLLFVTKPFFGKNDSKDTKKLVRLLAIKLSKTRIYNKISRTLLRGFGGLGHYDILRRLVGVAFSCPFELFVMGCILNPETNELRSQLPFGNYNHFSAYVYRPRWKWIPKLRPVIREEIRLNAITEKQNLKGRLSVRFRIILLLRKEIAKSFSFYKSFVYRINNTANNPSRFEWTRFLSSIFNRLTVFKRKNELFIAKRNKQFRANLLLNTFVKKWRLLITRKILTYFSHNKKFFQVISCFFTDFDVFNSLLTKNIRMKVKPRNLVFFRHHGSVVGNTFNEAGVEVLQQRFALVSLLFLKEIVSARSQFCAFSYPKPSLKFLKRKYYRLISNLCVLDFVTLYKTIVISTIKFSKVLKRVRANLKPIRREASRSRIKIGNKRIPKKYFFLLKKTSVLQGNSAKLFLLLKLLRKKPLNFSFVGTSSRLLAQKKYPLSELSKRHSGLLKSRFLHLRRLLSIYKEDYFDYYYSVKMEPIVREFLKYKKALKAARKAYFKKKYAKKYYSRGYNQYKNKKHYKRNYNHNYRHNNNKNYSRANNYYKNNRNNFYANKNRHHYNNYNNNSMPLNRGYNQNKNKHYTNRNNWGKPYFGNYHPNNKNNYRNSQHYNNTNTNTNTNNNNNRNDWGRGVSWGRRPSYKFNGYNTNGARWNTGHKKYLGGSAVPHMKRKRSSSVNLFKESLVPVEYYQPRKRRGTYLPKTTITLGKKGKIPATISKKLAPNSESLFGVIPLYVRPSVKYRRVTKTVDPSLKNKKWAKSQKVSVGTPLSVVSAGVQTGGYNQVKTSQQPHRAKNRWRASKKRRGSWKTSRQNSR